MRKLVTGALIAAVMLLSMATFAMEAVTVIQKGRVFSVKEVTVPRGGAVNFTNEDDFAHQLNVHGPNMDLDSDMQAQGQTISVPFPNTGKFQVRCGIHPRMHLTVQVE